MRPHGSIDLGQEKPPRSRDRINSSILENWFPNKKETKTKKKKTKTKKEKNKKKTKKKKKEKDKKKIKRKRKRRKNFKLQNTTIII